MKNKPRYFFFRCLVLLCIIAFNACSSNDNAYEPIKKSPVVLHLEAVPYPKLSDYQFFTGDIKSQLPAYGVLPFKPASELFSDYAKKKRFVWLPNATKATYISDAEVLDLPVGAALIKTFYYDYVQPANATKIIETRVMIRKATGWIFATYIWNNEQTDAVLQMQGSSNTVSISWIDQNNTAQFVDYKIPSESDCLKCHAGASESKPIGIKPQNLNSTYNYTSGSRNQLAKWIEFGYLEDNLPATIVATVNYTDTTQSLDLRVRSYFDINCAHCHREDGDGMNVDLRMAFNQTVNPANMGVCQPAALQVPGITHGLIIDPNNASASTMFSMLTTTQPGFRMPRVGRTVVHQEGVQLVQQWINSLPQCH